MPPRVQNTRLDFFHSIPPESRTESARHRAETRSPHFIREKLLEDTKNLVTVYKRYCTCVKGPGPGGSHLSRRPTRLALGGTVVHLGK